MTWQPRAFIVLQDGEVLGVFGERHPTTKLAGGPGSQTDVLAEVYGNEYEEAAEVARAMVGSLEEESRKDKWIAMARAALVGAGAGHVLKMLAEDSGYVPAKVDAPGYSPGEGE